MSHTVVLRGGVKHGNCDNRSQGLSAETRQMVSACVRTFINKQFFCRCLHKLFMLLLTHLQALFTVGKGSFKASDETFVVPTPTQQRNGDNREQVFFSAHFVFFFCQPEMNN